MKRLLSLGLALVLCSTAALAAQNRQFGVWDLPAAIPGTMIITIDFDTNVFVATYQINPPQGQPIYGVVQGTVKEEILTGQYYQLSGESDVSDGDMALTLLDKALDLHVAATDGNGTLAYDYQAAYKSFGTKQDLETFRSIKDRVQNAAKTPD